MGAWFSMSLLRNIKSWSPFHTRLYKVQVRGYVRVLPLCELGVYGSLPKGRATAPIPQPSLFLISTRPQHNALLLERLLIHYKYVFTHSSFYSATVFLWKSWAVDRKHNIWVPFTAECVATFSQSLLWMLNKHCMLHVTISHVGDSSTLLF